MLFKVFLFGLGLMMGVFIGVMLLALISANREDDRMNITIEEYDLTEDDLLEAIDVIERFCERKEDCKNCQYCKDCPVKRLCKI